MKRFALLLMVCLLFLTSFSVSANDADFEIDNNGVLTSYKGSDENVVIPDGVKSIGDNVFRWKSGIKTVKIPTGVTSIGDYAFSECSSLESVTIPVSVVSIGQYAFSSLENMKSITIPNSVTKIDFGVFSGSTGLTSVTLSDKLTSIGDLSFSGCTGLTSVNIPKGVTTINSSAFNNCSSLTSVTIPDSVVLIDIFAFSGCTSLKNITIPYSVTTINSTAFDGCTGLTSFTVNIPDGVTSIADNRFSGWSFVTDITIPETVTSIGNRAFENCTNLGKLKVPEAVNKIGSSAFSKNTVIEAGCGSYAEQYASENGYTASIYCEKVKPGSLRIFGASELLVGKTDQFRVEFDQDPQPTNKKVTWTSGNTEVASISEEGLVTGISLGSAEIKACAKDDPSICNSITITITPTSRPSTTGTPQSSYDPCQSTRQGFVLSLTENIEINTGTTLYDKNGRRIQVNEGNDANKEFLFIIRKCVDENCNEISRTPAYIRNISDSEKNYQTTGIFQTDGVENGASRFLLKASPLIINNVTIVVQETGKYVIFTFASNNDQLVPVNYYQKIYTTISDKGDLLTCTSIANTGHFRAYLEDINTSLSPNTLKFEHIEGAENAIIENRSPKGLIFPLDLNIQNPFPDGIGISDLQCSFEALSGNGQPQNGFCHPDKIFVPLYTRVTIVGGTLYLNENLESGDYSTSYTRTDVQNRMGMLVSVIGSRQQDNKIYSISGPYRVLEKQSITLTAVIGENSQIQSSGVFWSTSNKKIATVEGGTVTGKKTGDVEIRACSVADPSVCASKTVTVIPLAKKVVIADIDDGTKTIDLGTRGTPFMKTNYRLSASVSPADAKQDIIWSSQNPSIATVNQYGMVTATGIGKVSIIATAADGSNKSKSFKLEVISGIQDGSITITGESLVIQKKKVTLNVSYGQQVLPVKGKLTWSSSDPSIAKVSNKGVVTGVSEGNAVITACSTTDSSVCGSFTIHSIGIASSVVINDNDNGSKLIDIGTAGTANEKLTYSLSANILPANVQQNLIWTSSNPDVASVDENGLVTGHAVGSANITATSDDNAHKKAKVTVKVTSNVQPGSLTLSGPDSLGIKETKSLTASFSQLNQPVKNKINWSSSDTAVAKVKNGDVTGISDGSAVITACSKENPAVCTARTVYVGLAAPAAPSVMLASVSAAETGGSGPAADTSFAASAPVPAAEINELPEAGQLPDTAPAPTATPVPTEIPAAVSPDPVEKPAVTLTPVPENPLSADVIRLEDGNFEMTVNSVKQLSFAQEGIFFGSGDENIAKVGMNSGEITAMKPGTTTVYAASIDPLEVIALADVTVTGAEEVSEGPAEEPTAEPAPEVTEESDIEPTAEVTEEMPADPTAEVTEVTPADPTQEVTEEPPADPTQEVTEEPPADPSQEITEEPPADPTQEITEEPPAEPTAEVTEELPADPTQEVTEEQPADPTAEVTEEPPADPTAEVTEEPPADPTQEVTEEPPAEPTQEVTEEPPADPTQEVTEEPPADPTQEVTEEPPADPTQEVTEVPPADPAWEVTEETAPVQQIDPYFVSGEYELPVGETLFIQYENPDNIPVYVVLSEGAEKVEWDESNFSVTAIEPGDLTILLTTAMPYAVKDVCLVHIPEPPEEELIDRFKEEEISLPAGELLILNDLLKVGTREDYEVEIRGDVDSLIWDEEWGTILAFGTGKAELILHHPGSETDLDVLLIRINTEPVPTGIQAEIPAEIPAETPAPDPVQDPDPSEKSDNSPE